MGGTRHEHSLRSLSDRSYRFVSLRMMSFGSLCVTLRNEALGSDRKRFLWADCDEGIELNYPMPCCGPKSFVQLVQEKKRTDEDICVRG